MSTEIRAQRAAFLALAFLAAIERFLRTALEFLRQVLVEALDAGQFVEFDIGDLFQRAEAFGDQQLRQRLVDVQFVLEHLGILDELLLTLLGGIRLSQDVDGLAGQLAGEAHVLEGEITGNEAAPTGSAELDGGAHGE